MVENCDIPRDAGPLFMAKTAELWRAAELAKGDKKRTECSRQTNNMWSPNWNFQPSRILFGWEDVGKGISLPACCNDCVLSLDSTPESL